LWRQSTFFFQIKIIALSPHSYVDLKVIVRILPVHMFMFNYLFVQTIFLMTLWIDNVKGTQQHCLPLMTLSHDLSCKTRNNKSMFLLRWWATAYSELVFFSSHLSCIVGHNKPHKRQSSKYVSRPIWNNVNIYVLRSVVCYVSVHEISETIAVYQIAIKYVCESNKSMQFSVY